MILGPWGRVLIMGIAALVVIIAIMIVACFVGPGCWGYEYLERESKRRKTFGSFDFGNSSNVVQLKHLGDNAWLSDNGSVYDTIRSNAPIIEKQQRPSVYSTISDNSLPHLRCVPVPGVFNSITPSSPELHANIDFTVLNQETSYGRLTLEVIEAKSLPRREYTSTLEPYVILQIYKGKAQLQKSDVPLLKAETRIVRHTHNPTFNERFCFEGKRSDVKNWYLNIKVYDRERLVKDNLICESSVHLKTVEDIFTTDSIIPLRVTLTPKETEYGDLLFGVSYLPTAQRLSISFIKANRLKYLEVVDKLSDFYPYIRVLMVNGSGRCLKKKKSCFKHAEDSPVFNETLTFDLLPSQLETVVFIILLCSKTYVRQASSDGSSTETETENKPRKDKTLGKIVLGRNVMSQKARDHWVTVMQSPRKVVSVWQTLK